MPDHDDDVLTGAPDEVIQRIDTSKAHPARVYDALLGGKNNYPVDRAAAAAGAGANPRGRLDVRHNRDFLRRAVTVVTGVEGIRQYLDIGSGLPTEQNVHQIAQKIAPESRVVYADNDPIVLAHARALLTSHPEGATDYIDGDLVDAGRILEQAAKTLDFDQPVGIVLAAILHFVKEDDAYRVVRELVDAVPSGSRLILSHLASDIAPEMRVVGETMSKRGFTFELRSHAEVLRFFEDNGLELLEPGLVPVNEWRPDGNAPVLEVPGEDFLETLDEVEKLRYVDLNEDKDSVISIYGAVGRKI